MGSLSSRPHASRVGRFLLSHPNIICSQMSHPVAHDTLPPSAGPFQAQLRARIARQLPSVVWTLLRLPELPS